MLRWYQEAASASYLSSPPLHPLPGTHAPLSETPVTYPQAKLAVIHNTVTVMFLDIENFTDTVEAMSNTEVVVFYGDVMTALTNQIIRRKGTAPRSGRS